MTEELIPDPRRGIMAAIRDLFSELGAVSIEQLWDAARDRGIIPADVQHQLLRRGGTEFCRRALKETGQNGLPFAKPLSDETSAKWQQLALFDFEEACDLLLREHQAIEVDVEKLSLLADYFKDRFGRIPELPLVNALQRR